MIGTQQKRNNYVFGLQKGVVESGATVGMEQNVLIGSEKT